MIDRRTFALLVAPGSAALAALAARGQTGAARPLIGFVSAVKRDAEHIAAFEAGLRESGLEPGRHVTIAERYAEGSIEVMRRHIDELQRLGTTVFVTAGDNAMRLIQERSPSAAIVVAVLGNYGNVVLGGSLSRPPGNVTGFSNLSAELAGKRLDLLREMAGGISDIALLVNPAVAQTSRQPEAYRNAATSAGIRHYDVFVTPGTDLVADLAKAKAAGARGVIVYRNFLFETRRDEIIRAITAARLPSMFEERFFVRMGGLACYSPSLPDLFRRSAAYAARIIAGTPPGQLPIQLPAKFELVVNARTASSLGLTIPPTLLTFADEVIE